MTDRKSKEFRADSGYSREEWESVDFPELTDEELAAMRPAREMMPEAFFKELEARRRKTTGP
ncbi:hypothetical protein [Rhizobium sp. SGZ-381]|uniref:hypothetical protein n=1 Tax=Rhizobium sp. SGZ-381 TaxID=3342800 RepID=UPI00366ED01E